MESVGRIISAGCGSLVVPIKNHMGYLFSSTTYVMKMGTRMEFLDHIGVNVKEHMEANQRSNLHIPTHVRVWLEKVEKIKKDAESISTNGNGYLDVKSRYIAGKRASEITQDIDDLIEENRQIIWTNKQLPLGKVSSIKASTSTQLGSDTQNDFKSRDRVFKEALTFLQSNDNVQMIALCGMGGVGKTMMMERLRGHVRSNKTFDWIIKAVVGERTNLIAIQRAIADYMDQPLTETDETARADSLRMRFKTMSGEGETEEGKKKILTNGETEEGKKKILIILDDLWAAVDLKDIGLSPLPNGFKLLLTSRHVDECKKMAIQDKLDFRVVSVKVLEEPEAQYLFSCISGVLEESDPQRYRIGCDIVRKCGCLPLAINIIAKTLNSKEIFEWRDTLRRLKENDIDGNVHEVIMRSYNHLKPEERDIFLLCGLFPEDYDIPIEKLTRYAWGLQLLGKVRTLRDARDRTKTCVQNLKSAHLLIASHRLGCVKLHDLVLSFMVNFVSEGEHPWFINHGYISNGSNERYERISLTCRGMSEFPGDSKYPNLSFLNLMHGDESLRFLEDCYTRMQKLQVITFEKMQYPLLPGSLQCSTNLRTLCLSSCLLMDEFSHIGNLMNLEVLSFASCGIRKLPSTIGNLKKLKLLDVSGCVNLLIDDGVLGNLVDLEELYMRVDGGKTIRFTDTNCKELGELSRKLFALAVEFLNNKAEPKNVCFENLERFRISIGCSLAETVNDSFENTLKLVNNKAELLDCRINRLFDKTEVLHLEKVDGINNIEDILLMEFMHPPRLSLFYNLKDLHVSLCRDLRCLFTLDVVRSLSKLERLTISSCFVLEELIYVENTGERLTFQNLKYFSLKELPRLVSLCGNADLVVLPELVELTLEGLPNFTSIYPVNKSTISLPDDTSAMHSILNKVAIPKLEILKIKQMAKLKEMCPCQFGSIEDEYICRLREIEVYGCDSLVNLFPTNPMSWLHNLERLVVWGCDSIEVIFNLDLGCVHEIMEGSSRLRRIRVSDLGKLNEVWRMKGVNDSHYINCFRSVTHIDIFRCKSLKKVFTPTTANFDLGALEYIKLWSCVSLGESGRKNGWMESSTNTPCQEINVASMGETSRVDDDDNIPNVAFPSHLICTFHHVGGIQLWECDRVEVVFEIESPSNISGRELGTIHNNQVLLSHLKELDLERMRRMSHVWKCNWNKFLIPQPLESPFHNLTKIELRKCESIKYLFSPLMARLLSNLKQVYIFRCNGMEEVVSNRDDEDEEMSTSTFTHTNTVFFPQLDTLQLWELLSLKCIGGGRVGGWSNKITSNINAIGTSIQVAQACGVSWSLCQYPKKITIMSCHALSSVIPSHAIGQLKKLEELFIRNCKSMVEVFGTERVNNDSIYYDERSCGSNDAVTIPRPKNMTLLELSNLKILTIISCVGLGHVFTFSTLESLKQLKKLTIRDCSAMQVIVKEEDRERTTSKVVVFPNLKSLKLFNLPNLNGFFLGMNDFQWPLLDMVHIGSCPQMMVFTCGLSTAPKLNYIHTSLGKHSLECGLNFHITTGNASQKTQFHSSSACSTSDSIKLLQFPWSFSNLIEVDRQGYFEDQRHIIFPCNELLKLQNLEKLHFEYCPLEEVFEVVEGTNDDAKETQSVVIFSKLKEMTLYELQNLRYMWKSNQWTILEFPNLTRVSIGSCNKLEYVFTCSMVGSLSQLQELHIGKCEKMEVIVKEAKVVHEEEETDATTNEIVFPCLKSLKLEELPSLKGFCLEKEDFLWPSLDTLKFKDCPEIMVFTNGELTMPKLKVIDTSFGRCYAKEDLNSFIKTKKQEGFSFGRWG